MKFLSLFVPYLTNWVLGGALIWFAVFLVYCLIKNKQRTKNDGELYVSVAEVLLSIFLVSSGILIILNYDGPLAGLMKYPFGALLVIMSGIVTFLQLKDKKNDLFFLRNGINVFLIVGATKLLAGPKIDGMVPSVWFLSLAIFAVIMIAIYVKRKGSPVPKEVVYVRRYSSGSDNPNRPPVVKFLADGGEIIIQ